MIDACVFHEWASIADLAPYLSESWREVCLRPGDRGGMMTPKSNWWYRNPYGSKVKSAFAAQRVGPRIEGFGTVNATPRAVAMSTFDVLATQLLANGRRERIVLGFNDGLLATAFPNHYLAMAVVAAANDWTIEQWLGQDDRLVGLVMVSTAIPEMAAAEIRRAGRNDRMVGVALGLNVLGKSFGHPIYQPVFRAAADLDLPLVLQVGCDASTDLMTQPLAGGLSVTYAENDAFGIEPLMTHLADMIVGGVFDLFPNLKVMVVGGGTTWAPAFLWRLNFWYSTIQNEAPWLRQLPSDYFRDHVRLSTYSLESVPKPDDLRNALDTLPGVESNLIYASGYPNIDFLEPADVARRLPAAWHDKVFHDNALEFFRWPGSPSPDPAVPGLHEGAVTENLAGPSDRGSA